MANRIRRDDVVVIVAGKDKGRRGRVLRVLKDENRVIVEGLNKVVRHKRANPQNPAAGGRVSQEAAIHISNVMPWSEQDKKGVRVRMSEEKGKKVRVSTCSGSKLATSTAAVAVDTPATKKGGAKE